MVSRVDAAPQVEDFTSLDEAFGNLPDDAFERLQFVVPAAGCPNACTFCSQRAETSTTELSTDTMQLVFSGLHAEAEQRGLRLGSERMHKPGVVYPHLDNDPMSYPGLLEYMDAASRADVKVRFSSIGYSRHNAGLQAMHEEIVSRHASTIDGVRFSISPYPVGLRGSQYYSTDEFGADLTNAIGTYLPLAGTIGFGRDRLCIATRMAPNVITVDNDLEAASVEGRRVLRIGPYSTIVLADEERLDEPARIVEMRGRKGILQHAGSAALLVVGRDNSEAAQVQREQEALRSLSDGTVDGHFAPLPSGGALARQGRLYKFHNADGDYYAFDPFGQIPERFDSLLMYPRTNRRKTAGYIDATRHVYPDVRSIQHDPSDVGSSTEAYDVLLERVADRATRLEVHIPDAADYIRANILPLLGMAMKSCKQAGVPPRALFGGGFLFDAGHIHNVGRATKLFRGLATGPEVSLTPVEQKIEQVDISNAAQRGPRWAVRPASGSRIEFAELHPITMDTTGPHGEQMRRLFVRLGDTAIEKRLQATSRDLLLMPGLRSPDR